MIRIRQARRLSPKNSVALHLSIISTYRSLSATVLLSGSGPGVLLDLRSRAAYDTSVAAPPRRA